MLVLYPTVIQPLFNKLTPLREGELRTRIEALAAKLKFPLSHLYEIDGSKRSSHSNAYYFGFFRVRRSRVFSADNRPNTLSFMILLLSRAPPLRSRLFWLTSLVTGNTCIPHKCWPSLRLIFSPSLRYSLHSFTRLLFSVPLIFPKRSLLVHPHWWHSSYSRCCSVPWNLSLPLS